MQTALIILWSTLLLLLQPDNLTLLQRIVLSSLVILGYLLIGDAYLLADTSESVTTTGIQVIVFVVDLDRMQQLTTRHMVFRVSHNKLVVARRCIILIELIQLNQLNQLVGITGICGITC